MFDEVGSMLTTSVRRTDGTGGPDLFDDAAATPLRLIAPPMLDVPQAAELLGIGRTLAYELVRTGKWPTPIVRIGRLIRVPSKPLLELLSTGSIAATSSGMTVGVGKRPSKGR